MYRFDLNRFREQIEMMKKMGPMRDLMSKIPGIGQMGMQDLEEIDVDAALKRTKGIIGSMTPAERHDPGLIDLARRRRIADGSGAETADVASLIKQFDAMAGVIGVMKRRKFR